MDETFLYNKSMEQRLNDYNDILRTGNRILPASKVKDEWSYYLDLVLDRAGWQALWKIPRQQCEQYDIPYPNVVIVYVENITVANLTATIKVLAVKNDIHLPDSIIAELIDLYPTVEQDQSIALNIELTAENLDVVRFFYRNIWMPWDYDQDECIDWPSEHLESRIKLHFDLKSGLIPKKTVLKIKSLIAEGQAIAERYQRLDDDSDNEMKEDVAELAKLHLRLIYVRSEFNLFENCDIREALMSDRQTIISKQTRHWLVLLSTKTVSEHYEYLKKYEDLYSKESIPNIASSLSDACKMSEEVDTIYLSNGKYSLNSLDDLENGGKIIGFFEPHNTIITDESFSTPTFLLMLGSHLRFENITFLFENICSTGFSFRKGQIYLKNCIIDTSKHTRQAIVVHPEAEVTLEKCRITNFELAVVCKPGGVLNIIDSTITRNNSGLVLYDDSKVNIVRSTINFAKDYGICVASTQSLPKKLELEEFSTMFPNCKLSGAIVDENGKGDYQIVRKMKSIKEIKSCHDVSMESMEVK